MGPFFFTLASGSGPMCLARLVPTNHKLTSAAVYSAGMKRVLLTGMSGTGKSTVIRELARLGHKAIDLDEPGWSELANVAGQTGPSAFGAGRDWIWWAESPRYLCTYAEAQICRSSQPALRR
jgi:hypothetical protein